MSPDQIEQLQKVNTEVNEIPYNAILGPGEGGDVWKDSPDGGSWECRDYCLKKAIELQKLGWPQEDMTIIRCWTEPEGTPPKREFHAVLAVEEDGKETWILDSRFPFIYQMNMCPADYVWHSRQIAGTTDFKPIG